MFPFIRLAAELVRARRMTPIAPTDVHVSHHRIMPWDLDMFLELNNGRVLTLFDIGRLASAQRSGLMAAIRREGWAMTMAGSYVRYRRRIRGLERVKVTTRVVCADARFSYIEQAMWKSDGECAHHAVYRAVVTDAAGIVPTARVRKAIGHAELDPPMPDWIAAWVAAEDHRPWPPMQDTPPAPPRALAAE